MRIQGKGTIQAGHDVRDLGHVTFTPRASSTRAGPTPASSWSHGGRRGGRTDPWPALFLRGVQARPGPGRPGGAAASWPACCPSPSGSRRRGRAGGAGPGARASAVHERRETIETAPRPGPTALVIFGAGGDLPGASWHQPSTTSASTAGSGPVRHPRVGRKATSDEDLRARLRDGVDAVLPRPPEDAAWNDFAGKFRAIQAEFDCADATPTWPTCSQSGRRVGQKG